MRSAIKKQRAEFERDDAEGELLQDGCAKGGVLAAQAEQRLDMVFPRIKILLHFAGEDFAELGVDAADVCGEGFNGGQQDQRGDDEGRHVRALGAAARSMRPSGKRRRARRRRSRRAIGRSRLRDRSRRDEAGREG